jgi:lipopolysaccharide exporter
MGKVRQLIDKRLPPGSFLRNVVTLMTGTTFAQALAILVSPILTRLYGPVDYGVLALYSSILGIVGVIACWRYELAIVLPEKDEDAVNLLVLSISITLIMSLLTLIMVALFRQPVARLLGAPELAPWLWFLPLSLLAIGLFQAFNYWSTRRKQFKRLAARQITQSTVTIVTQLGTGITLHPGPGGLIGGSILGQLAATGRLAWQIGRDEGTQILKAIQRKRLKYMLLRYSEFPLYSSWAILLNTISAMLPALLLGYFFTPVVVGFFALGHRVLAMPMGVIGNSLAQVFFPEATVSHRQGNLGPITLKIFKQLVSLGIVPIVLLTIVAPDLFALVFGSRWVMAGEYVRWLSLWVFFQFISSPISTVYMVLEKQRAFLAFNIFLLLTRIIALAIGGFYNDELLSIILFGTSGFIMYLFFTVNILHMAGIQQAKVWSVIGFEILKSIPYALVPIVVIYIFDNSLLFVLSAIVSGMVFLIQSAYTRKSSKA